MSGIKRAYNGREMEKASHNPPIMCMFLEFREELDRYHDTRERIMKATRDVTAISKKIIFSLHRACGLKQDIPLQIAAEVQERLTAITGIFTSISSEIQGVNAWRHQRQVSPGIQEFIEAISFEHYLRTQSLIRWEQASCAISNGIILTSDDYILGLFDLAGEIMRFAITFMATNGSLPGCKTKSSSERTILMDLRLLRTHFEILDVTSYGETGLGKVVEKKMAVMKLCVEKVETAVYGMVVRGKERPRGWIPNLPEERLSLETHQQY